MSTLMSKDMILERSSTRLHAPPGGKSSICFGSYEEPAKAAPRARAQYAAPADQNVQPPVNFRRGAGATANESSAMKSIMGGEDVAAPVRRRQPPGGNSTLVIG